MMPQTSQCGVLACNRGMLVARWLDAEPRDSCKLACMHAICHLRCLHCLRMALYLAAEGAPAGTASVFVRMGVVPTCFWSRQLAVMTLCAVKDAQRSSMHDKAAPYGCMGSSMTPEMAA